MPELAEIARAVHFIRKHLVGHTIAKAQAQHDDLIFGKVGTSAAEFQKNMQGKKVIGAGQQGKYFWITMSSPPHPVIHFGMTGWLNIRNANTSYSRTTTEDKKVEEVWPPKFWKFMLETNQEPKTEAAFVDARRLGRVRLVDCPGDNIRDYTPLKENGPDPIADKDLVTEEWVRNKVRSKKVPIKALLLDQANISGLGNWMGDEILYQARIHPEQYSNTLQDNQIKNLHSTIHYICSVSVDLLGDSSQFPTDWLFHHRWNKGKKGFSGKLPNGDAIAFVTVGGRTSAIVPAVQSKTGSVAADVAKNAVDEKKGGEGDIPKATSRVNPKGEVTKKTPASAKNTSLNRPTRGKRTLVTPSEPDRNNAVAHKIPSRKRRMSIEKVATADSKADTTPNTKKARTVNTKVQQKEPQTPLRRGRSAAQK